MRESNVADRPVVAIPARFSDTASALRYRGEVVPRTLIEAVYAAGGEPLVVHPHAPEDLSTSDIASRLGFADAVLLPGGGDLSPTWTQSAWHETHYGVDLEQDRFDLAMARWATEAGIPLLAICRGMQVLNVALGGTTVSDMRELPGEIGVHLDLIHQISVVANSTAGRLLGPSLEVSCFHHQCIENVAPSLRAVAHSSEGIVEAVEAADPGRDVWALGVQWHPEDTAALDVQQARLFEAFVDAARRARDLKAAPACV